MYMYYCIVTNQFVFMNLLIIVFVCQVILDDIAMLHIEPDIFSYTSDYFDKYIEFAGNQICFIKCSHFFVEFT